MIVPLLTALLLVLGSGCSSPENPAWEPPRPVDGILKSPDSEIDPGPHGLLAPPDLAGKLREIRLQDLRLNPIIEAMDLFSGRYFDPVPVPDGEWAAACLKGVDFFRTDPAGNLILSGSVPTEGHAWSLAVAGGDIWIADGYAGIVILDGETHRTIERWPELDNARYIVSGGDFAVICRHRSGVTIVSIQHSNTAGTLSHLPLPARAVSACVFETHLYIGTIGGGYFAYDISDLRRPLPEWTFIGPERIEWCERRDGFHFLIDRDVGLWILADRDGGPPEICSVFPLDGETRRAAFWSGSELILARKCCITAVDISDPHKPVLIDSIPASNEGRGVAVRDNRIFFCDGDWGVKEIRLDNSGLAVAAGYRRERLVADVAVKGHYGFAANTHAGLQILDLNSPTPLNPVTVFTDLAYPFGIDIQNDLAAVADASGLSLIDIADPVHPRLFAHLPTPGQATGVCLGGGHAFVADWFSGLHAVDVSDPAAPVLLSTADLPGWTIDVAISGDYAYACCVNGGLASVDIRDPGHLRIAGIDTTCVAPEGIAVKGSTLYLADFNTGLLVYSLDQPDCPRAVSYYSLDVCKGVQVSGDLLLVSNYLYGVRLFDIAVPFNPVLIGQIDTPGKAYEAAFIPDFPRRALIADWHELLLIGW
ncbi:hypothetical protein JXA40_02255 [bacterium]|nr:hypothetical protein [candidate division CSSED10-310 bacterium]